jgi:Flp pilus assembly protein TadD
VNHGQDSVLNLGNLAVCYLALGQEREALDWFERAYERNPRSTVVLKNLAGLHHLAGRDGLAERFGREYEALTGERP